MTDEDPWARIVGPCYTSASLARVLRWTETDVTEAAASLRILEVVTNDGAVLYPAFQVADGRVVAGLPEVLQVLSTGTRSRWTWAQWLNGRLKDEDGNKLPSAVEQLSAGELDDVLREAHHDAWAWSS
ncbi:hypothetical protein [Microbacterium sp. NPDC090003]|uniref:hypothetical protein n=1 Tax=Microbacterium sp. NPDC090003 TaxID=3364203 RepID=UPI003829A4DE